MDAITFAKFGKDPAFSKAVRKLEFLREVEKLKEILRRNHILGGLRRENDAEHSWHIALMAVLFFEDAAESDVDLLRVLKMLLIHDLVEIDAGDAYAFDVEANLLKADKERLAADRIFGLLPEELGCSLRELWDEFDAGKTSDAQFALALDRLQPALQNYLHHGVVWKQNDIRPRQVRERLISLQKAIPNLARLAEEILNDAENQGFYNEE